MMMPNVMFPNPNMGMNGGMPGMVMMPMGFQMGGMPGMVMG